jgi:xanthine dehydrogenase YagS FAD-binding subunit
MSDGKVADARVVLSGAAPIPWRAVDAETALTGNALDSDSIKRAAVSSVKGAQSLKHNAYKLPLFRGMIEEELTNLSRR